MPFKLVQILARNDGVVIYRPRRGFVIVLNGYLAGVGGSWKQLQFDNVNYKN